MKKTLLTLLACTAVMFGMISCSQAEDETKKEHVTQVVDLRSKKGGEVSFRSATARAANTDFSYEMLPKLDNFIGENGVEVMYSKWVYRNGAEIIKIINYNDAEFAKIKAAITLADHKDGVEFTIKHPEGEDYRTKPFTWLNVTYVDEVGHKAVGVDIPNTEFGKEEVKVVFPLVDPNKPSATFWLQVCTAEYEAQLVYKVVPIHGYGCPDPVQEDYRIRDYLKITEDGKLSLVYTVPPKAKANTLQHDIAIYVQNSSKPQYSKEAAEENNDPKHRGFILESATAEEIAAVAEGRVVQYSIDLKEKFDDDQKREINKDVTENPYVWASFIYKYKVDIEGLDDYTFAAAWFISDVIKNPFVN